LAIAPLGALQNHAVAIVVFICLAPNIPVWIEGRNLLEPRSAHIEARGLPLSWLPCVEDCQVFVGRFRENWMTSAVCEFKVIVRTGLAQHDAVEAVVVLEVADDGQSKAAAVHDLRLREVADRASDPKVVWHGCVREAEAV